MGRRPKVHREEVLAAARSAFAERGFEATTLAAIAAKLGVSPAALRRHAASKQELFAACMTQGSQDPLPIEFLNQLDGGEDPREVFLRIGRLIVPFVERKLDEHIARFMGEKSGEALLPFIGHPRPTPPQRGYSLFAEYVRRAAARGRLRVADPQAAALVFFASLHSYVVLQRVLQVPDPPLPLERYLATLLEIWEVGGIAERG